MSERVCECGCGQSLAGMRPQARFCSPAHRAAASRTRAAERARLAGRPASPERPPSAEEERVLTQREAAAALGVTTRTVQRWMRAGLPFERRRNGRPRFALREILKWQRQPVESRRLAPLSCAACGHAIEVVIVTAGPALRYCPCCASPLRRTEGAS